MVNRELFYTKRGCGIQVDFLMEFFAKNWGSEQHFSNMGISVYGEITYAV